MARPPVTNTKKRVPHFRQKLPEVGIFDTTESRRSVAGQNRIELTNSAPDESALKLRGHGRL